MLCLINNIFLEPCVSLYKKIFVGEDVHPSFWVFVQGDATHMFWVKRSRVMLEEVDLPFDPQAWTQVRQGAIVFQFFSWKVFFELFASSSSKRQHFRWVGAISGLVLFYPIFLLFIWVMSHAWCKDSRQTSTQECSGQTLSIVLEWTVQNFVSKN